MFGGDNFQGVFVTANSDEGRAMARDIAAIALTELYGGATITENEGYWRAADGSICQETSYLVWAYGENQHGPLLDLARRLLNEFNQESVLVVVDGHQLFISQSEGG